MSRFNRRIVSSLVAMAALTGLVLAVSGTSATASTPKYFSLVIAPNPIPGGATSTVTATVKDESIRRLSSVDVFLPAASVMSVQSASIPATATATIGTCTDGTLTGACVKLRNLGLSAGASATLSLSVQTPPACTDVAAAFNAAVPRTGEEEDGGGGTLDTANSVLSSVVHDICHLLFGTQPASAIVNQTISGTAFTPTGPAITVGIYDIGGSLVSTSTAPVTVSLQNNLSGATLGVTLTENAVGGTATFGDLNVNMGQDNYALGAANLADPTHYAPTSSSPFNIAQQGTACTGASCTLTSTGTGGGSGKVVATPATTGGTGELVESANISGQSPLVCTGYTNYDPNTYEVTTTGTTAFSKVFTITIVNPAGAPPYDRHDRDNEGPNGDGDNDADDFLLTQHICFQAPYMFTPLGGGPPVYTGLLPACPRTGTPTGPCDNRAADALVPNGSATPPGYNIVLQAVIPPNALGDPRMH